MAIIDSFSASAPFGVKAGDKVIHITYAQNPEDNVRTIATVDEVYPNGELKVNGEWFNWCGVRDGAGLAKWTKAEENRIRRAERQRNHT